MPSSPSQTASGKAFEYALALECEAAWGAIITGEAAEATEAAFRNVTEDERIERRQAAGAALEFLAKKDRRLTSGNVVSVELQPDNVAIQGDVRDLVVRTSVGNEIGLSAKNRSRAIRNPRVSHTHKFGESWFGIPCSQTYRDAMDQVFDFLAPMEATQQPWPDEDTKNEMIYVPTLAAFMDEVRGFFDLDQTTAAHSLMSYMLGIADYYMIYKQNGDVAVQAFNMNNTLRWGRNLPMPTRLVELDMKPDSPTTVFMIMDAGWQLSFRIHNAEGTVKRSLKFEVKVIGHPYQLTQHHIQYR